MALSRSLTHSLRLKPHPPHLSTLLRHRSSKPHQAQVIELDLDSSSASASASASDGFRKLEEVLQSIIARRAAPDWLPFLPGYSYYVPPPPPSNSLIEVLGRLSDSQLSNSGSLSKGGFSRDEIMSFGTNQGWPSSDYFIEGTVPTRPHPMGEPSHPHPLGLVVEVKICDGEEAAQESSSEDE